MKMKPAITVTTTILVCALAASLALAQSPSMIQTTRDKTKAVSGKAPAASKQALGIRQPVPAAASAKPVANAKPAAAPSKAAVAAPGKSAAGASSVGVKKTAAKPVPAVAVRKSVPAKAIVPVPKENPPAAASAAAGSAEGENSPQAAPDGKYAANGRRDPFISPVVSHTGGSGCSTGKKCLEIGAINLRGVVHADSGFIAVVSNNLNKAYFLRENDPVFNGYVVKITGDSIVFQETVQDRLGKTFTREVVKKITTPAV